MRANLRLSFLGPQGSGKGTQAQLLEDNLGYRALSMGALLRQVAEQDSPLGKEVESITKAGTLVPTALTLDILHQQLKLLPAEQGYILDGFPRTIDQAKALEKIAPLDRVVVFEIGDAESIRRLVTRLNCPAGHIFNTITKPPKKDGICDYDGQTLFRRDDDHEEAVRQRLQIYHTETMQVLAYYEALNKLIHINGEAEIDKIYRHLVMVLKEV